MAENDLIEAYQPIAAQFEGNVPWMYRDARGYLTIGIGHLLYKPSDPAVTLNKAIKALWNFGGGPRHMRQSGTQALDFVQACTARKPGPSWKSVQRFITSVDTASGEIKASHDKVFGVLGIELPDESKPAWKTMVMEAEMIMKLPYGQRDAGGFFHCYNSFELTQDATDELFAHDVQAAIDQLTGEKWVHPDPKKPWEDFKTAAYPEFQGFDSFPDEVKMVIIDLAFQLGAAGLAHYEGGAFRKAVGQSDWMLANKYCPQPADAQAERNQWRRSQLLTASAIGKTISQGSAPKKTEVKSTTVEKPKVPLYMDQRSSGKK